MFNFNLPPSQLQFYLGEIIFTSLTIITIFGTRNRLNKTPNVKFKSLSPLQQNTLCEDPKIYIQVKDVIIDTYSAIPKRDPQNIEKMDPIGNSIQSIENLLIHYDIYFIYVDFEEVWWLRKYFGNKILKQLKTYPKKDGIFISTQPDELSGNNFIKFGNENNWPEIEKQLLKKIIN